jgi:hypothetical protein
LTVGISARVDIESGSFFVSGLSGLSGTKMTLQEPGKESSGN